MSRPLLTLHDIEYNALLARLTEKDAELARLRGLVAEARVFLEQDSLTMPWNAWRAVNKWLEKAKDVT